MNTPTKLTIMRIVMAFAIVLLLLFPFYSVGIEFPKFIISGVYVKSQYIIAGILFILASFTDFLDGYLARKNNQITNTGKMLDAIADKILVNPILIILAYQGLISPWIPVIIVVRDITVNAIKMEAASKGKVVAAISSGKIKTATLMIGIALVFFYNLPFELINLRVSDFLLYFAAIMSILSMIEYYQLNKKLLSDQKEEK